MPTRESPTDEIEQSEARQSPVPDSSVANGDEDHKAPQLLGWLYSRCIRMTMYMSCSLTW